MEGGAGFDFGYKLDATNLIRGGFGYAQNSNKNSRDMTLLPTPEVAFDRSGMNANVGTTLLLGPENLISISRSAPGRKMPMIRP